MFKNSFVIIFAMLMLIFSSNTFAQTFENVSAIQLNGGFTIPFGEGTGDWKAGVLGRLLVRFPASQSISAGVEAGIAGPSSKEDGLELMQFPLLGFIFIPVAPEAASTPFLALGLGVTVNNFIFNTNYVGTPPDNYTDTFFTYVVKLGYTLRPESMTSTLFSFDFRYDQQIINDDPDWRDIDLEIGVGYCF